MPVVVTSIWIALALLCVSAVLRWLSPAAPDNGGCWQLAAARWCWTLAVPIYALHVAAAFHVVHHWSHAAAMEHVAQQSQAVVGWRFGAGIWFNHLFGLLLASEMLWWWIQQTGYLRRPAWINVCVFGYLGFIAFNGAFVF